MELAVLQDAVFSIQKEAAVLLAQKLAESLKAPGADSIV
jgi:hypothetical protein